MNGKRGGTPEYLGRLAGSLDPLKIAVVQLDRLGRISYCSPLLERLLPEVHRPLLGKKFREVLQSDPGELVAGLDAIASGTSASFLISFIGSKGAGRLEVTAGTGSKNASRGRLLFLKDITEEQWKLRRTEFLDRLTGILTKSDELEETIRKALRLTHDFFGSDRTWLLTPCDPGAKHFRVPYEITEPEFPGAMALDRDLPINPGEAVLFRNSLEATSALAYSGDDPYLRNEQFGVKSQLHAAFRPKIGRPWILGLHQCSHARHWRPEEKVLLYTVAQRIGDAISHLLLIKSLREREANFRALAENAQIGILVVDGSNRIIFLNPYAAKALARTPGGGYCDLFQLLAPEYRELITARLAARRRGEKVAGSLELMMCRSDGSPIPIEAAGAQTSWEGSPATLLVFRDITERKKFEVEREALLHREQKARAEAERANESKNQFLAVVSHELKTPLTAIMTWSQLLAGKLPPEKISYAASQIEQSARSQNQIINDLLDVSRIVMKKLNIERMVFDPGGAIRSVVEKYHPLAERKSVGLDLTLEENLPQVHADPRRLRQIIENLLSNAFKFTPSGGSIRVSVRKQDPGSVLIEVTDSGIGIDSGLLPQIFERFMQVDNSITRKSGGLGLGLAIVKNLAELQGGRVWAESAGLGLGASFNVVLPAAGELAPPAVASVKTSGSPPEEAAPRHLRDLRILVVDDEEGVRESLVAGLSLYGANVRASCSAGDALEKISVQRPDLVLVDLAMPEVDGLSLIAMIRKMYSHPRFPAVAISAFTSPEYEAKALESGFDAFTAKPVDISELVSLLWRLHTPKESSPG